MIGEKEYLPTSCGVCKIPTDKYPNLQKSLVQCANCKIHAHGGHCVDGEVCNLCHGKLLKASQGQSCIVCKYKGANARCAECQQLVHRNYCSSLQPHPDPNEDSEIHVCCRCLIQADVALAERKRNEELCFRKTTKDQEEKEVEAEENEKLLVICKRNIEEMLRNKTQYVAFNKMIHNIFKCTVDEKSVKEEIAYIDKLISREKERAHELHEKSKKAESLRMLKTEIEQALDNLKLFDKLSEEFLFLDEVKKEIKMLHESLNSSRKSNSLSTPTPRKPDARETPGSSSQSKNSLYSSQKRKRGRPRKDGNSTPSSSRGSVKSSLSSTPGSGSDSSRTRRLLFSSAASPERSSICGDTLEEEEEVEAQNAKKRRKSREKKTNLETFAGLFGYTLANADPIITSSFTHMAQNTKNNYIPKMIEFREWCEDTKVANCTVTEKVLLDFLQHIHKQRPTLNLHGHQSAVKKMYRIQQSLGINSHPDPLGETVANFNKGIRKQKSRQMKDNKEDLGQFTSISDITAQETAAICSDCLNDKGNETDFRVRVRLRTAICIMSAKLDRSDNALHYKMNEISARMVEQSIPSEEPDLDCLVFLQLSSKTKKDGKPVAQGAFRNVDVCRCPVCAVALELFRKHHIDGKANPFANDQAEDEASRFMWTFDPLLDFSGIEEVEEELEEEDMEEFDGLSDDVKQALLDGKESADEKRYKAKAYNSFCRALKKVFKKFGVNCEKASHAFRRSFCRQVQELGGDRIGLVNFVGWELANNSMENYYTAQLEITIMKLLAGFPKEGICFLMRNWYPPEAEKLAKQIFPFAWEEIAKYDLSKEEQKKINFVPRLDKLGLLRLYIMCARVLVQDIPFLMTEENSDSRIWDFPLLHTKEFKEWSRMQVEHVQRLTVERPELTSIRQFAPNVESLYYQTNRAVGDIRDDVASLKDSVDARMDELENSLKIDMATLKDSMKVVQLSNENEIHARRSEDECNKRKLLEAMATALGISVKFEELNALNDEFENESVENDEFENERVENESVENESVENEIVAGRKGDEESEREIEGANLFPRRPPKKSSNCNATQQRKFSLASMENYTMKITDSVNRIYQEWYYGLGGNPSILELERACPSWRKKRSKGDGKDAKPSQKSTFGRRKKLVKWIEEYSNSLLSLLEDPDKIAEELLLKATLNQLDSIIGKSYCIPPEKNKSKLTIGKLQSSMDLPEGKKLCLESLFLAFGITTDSILESAFPGIEQPQGEGEEEG